MGIVSLNISWLKAGKCPKMNSKPQGEWKELWDNMVVVVVKMALKSDNMWKGGLPMEWGIHAKTWQETDALMASMIGPIQPSSVFPVGRRKTTSIHKVFWKKWTEWYDLRVNKILHETSKNKYFFLLSTFFNKRAPRPSKFWNVNISQVRMTLYIIFVMHSKRHLGQLRRIQWLHLLMA